MKKFSDSNVNKKLSTEIDQETLHDSKIHDKLLMRLYCQVLHLFLLCFRVFWDEKNILHLCWSTEQSGIAVDSLQL